MMLALGTPLGTITTIECSRHAFEELRHNIAIFHSLLQKAESRKQKAESWNFLPAQFSPKVTSEINQEIIGQFSLYYADACELLPAFLGGQAEVTCQQPVSILRDIPAQKFDFIFIDGAFRMTQDFFDLSLPLLNPGGTIIVDDAIKYRWKMGGFHEYLTEQNISYELIETDSDDGIMIIKYPH